jgi:putative ABC transport system ATP-binding protein
MNIDVNNLSKTYGQGDALTQVLDDVSFHIDAGEFVAIVGTSGSGKTTLLNVMGGLDGAYTGSIAMGAHKLDGLKERELARLRNEEFGFIFQQFHLLDHLTALENITLPEFFSRNARDASVGIKRAETLLEQMSLLHKKDARPGELSGGQKQRVAIARALFHNPSVLFCDEPTGSLDRATGEQIMGLFQELNTTSQLTLIVVTHEEHVAQMASRIIRLEDGVLCSDTRTDGTLKEED